MYIFDTTSITVFENHKKSLIQHCDRSELSLQFSSSLKMPKMVHCSHVTNPSLSKQVSTIKKYFYENRIFYHLFLLMYYLIFLFTFGHVFLSTPTWICVCAKISKTRLIFLALTFNITNLLLYFLENFFSSSFNLIVTRYQFSMQHRSATRKMYSIIN